MLVTPELNLERWVRRITVKKANGVGPCTAGSDIFQTSWAWEMIAIPPWRQHRNKIWQHSRWVDAILGEGSLQERRRGRRQPDGRSEDKARRWTSRSKHWSDSKCTEGVSGDENEKGQWHLSWELWGPRCKKRFYLPCSPCSQCDQHSIRGTYRIRTASPAINRLAFPFGGSPSPNGWPSGDWYCFLLPFWDRHQHSFLPACSSFQDYWKERLIKTVKDIHQRVE